MKKKIYPRAICNWPEDDRPREKLNKLKELFPEVFTEERVDWEKLEAALGEDINFSNERYVLN